jgi:hypothetical protein
MLVYFPYINQWRFLIMDILLSLLNLSEEKYEYYLQEIKKSNLPKEVQWDLNGFLQTALEQTKQAKEMGWL